jgi:hypothetical protein
MLIISNIITLVRSLTRPRSGKLEKGASFLNFLPGKWVTNLYFQY